MFRTSTVYKGAFTLLVANLCYCITNIGCDASKHQIAKFAIFTVLYIYAILRLAVYQNVIIFCRYAALELKISK